MVIVQAPLVPSFPWARCERWVERRRSRTARQEKGKTETPSEKKVYATKSPSPFSEISSVKLYDRRMIKINRALGPRIYRPREAEPLTTVRICTRVHTREILLGNLIRGGSLRFRDPR